MFSAHLFGHKGQSATATATVTEMVLSAIVPKADATSQKLAWVVEGEGEDSKEPDASVAVAALGNVDGTVVSFGPRETRTFLLGTSPKQ